MNTTILKDPRKYVEVYIGVKSIIVNERGELSDSFGKNNLQIFDTLYLDYLSQVHAHNALEKQKAANFRDTVTAIPEKIMQKAMSELITQKKLAYREQIIKSFKCETEDLSLIKTYVKAITGQQDADDIAVMCHWMWQVKTKMLGKTPSYHMMPIFFGKQEGGKTVAMNKLISPINNFRLNISLDQMSDDRYFRAMSENYVVVFDEMQGAERADIDALKKQVTIDDNDYRPLGTNEVFKVKQACSFIGATNRPVAEQIVDSTGMRRFWQINCLDKMDWPIITSIDYIAMWKGIDESRPDGYIIEQIDSVRAKQASLVAKEEITLYMESRGIVADKIPTKEILTSELYADYRYWASINGFKAMNAVWFGRRLSGKGITGGTKAINKKTVNFFNVPEEIQIHIDPFAE